MAEEEAEGPKLQPACDEDIFKLAQNGDVQGVARLLESGTDIETTDARGATALVWAARGGHVPLVKMLLSNSANVEHQAYGGIRPLHFAVNSLQEPTALLLLEDGQADANGADDQGNTSLHWAASRGVLGTVVLMKEHGAEVNVANKSKVTPLMRAAACGHTTVVPRLLQFGADYAAADADGNTALHYAARGQHAAIVTALLEAGAATDAKNKLNKLPADVTHSDAIKKALGA